MPLAIGGIHTLGATYNFGETSTAVRTKDHQINLQQLATTDAAVAETFDPVDIDNLQGRAAFRCTTPDYLPIAGPAPKLDDYLNDYAVIKKKCPRSHTHSRQQLARVISQYGSWFAGAELRPNLCRIISQSNLW